jgi:hypothetical protein
MKNKDSALWAARRIQRILSDANLRCKASSIPALSDLIYEQHSLEQCWRMLRTAHRREWTHAAELLRGRLFTLIASVRESTRAFRPARLAEVPSIGDVLVEITCLGDEFNEFEIEKKEKYIAVTTDDITLEDIRLGRFCIQLHFGRLERQRDASAFTIVAKDANTAAGDSAVTHPHVRNESLCAGEATAPIGQALAEGRVGDAFQLVNRVLHTYNGGSAYVSLDDWQSERCSDCESSMASDSSYHCESCDRDFCDNCTRLCNRCDQLVCNGCWETSDAGERLCPECKKLDDQEREEADDDEEIPPSEDAEDDLTEEPPTQPQTETIHEQFNTPHARPERAEADRAEHPGGATGDGEEATADISPPQAA